MNITILSGAGISAESGIKTFRDADGLWEGHDVQEVATPSGFNKNPTLVHEYYNARRAQLLEVSPNAAHRLIASWQQEHEVHVITQNVDDLHERAGSEKVLHLHGSLLSARSIGTQKTYFCDYDLSTDSQCPDGYPLRPDIVWFGEDVPLLSDAAELVSKSDMVIIIGTSMQVYPAASLFQFAPPSATVFYVDANPTPVPDHIRVIAKKATEGIQVIDQHIKNRAS